MFVFVEVSLMHSYCFPFFLFRDSRIRSSPVAASVYHLCSGGSKPCVFHCFVGRQPVGPVLKNVAAIPSANRSDTKVGFFFQETLNYPGYIVSLGIA